MARVEKNWERLVRATLQREQLRSGVRPGGRAPTAGLIASVPSSLGRTTNIDGILHAADEIQDEDPNVARILCEHAYLLAQNLDPNSEGRGVLQFKTGLMSVIKQKLAKKDGVRIDRSQDIARLREFYKAYRERHKVDELQEEEKKWRESGAFTGDPKELERRSVRMKRVYATLKVLGEVVEALTKDTTPEEAGELIPDDLKKVMQSDAAMTEEISAYNIVPLDAPAITNAIGYFPEVRAAVAALRLSRDLPQLPNDFPKPQQRSLDIFDLLQYVFGFQKDNINNQRENVLLLIANAQARYSVPEGVEPNVDETPIQEVFEKSLDNYIKWCKYLRRRPVWIRLDALNKEKKLVLVALYYLIWGEAANIRYLPECICYIFHNIARDLDEEILQQRLAQPAKCCISENGVSFLEQIISPVYKIIAAEAGNNDNGKASHSAWRNYDDFNEYFWSPNCFEIGWPWDKNTKFFSEPNKKAKAICSLHPRTGKSCFVEHRTFFHLYHSFHRLWIFLVMMFQGLTIIAFHDGKINMGTIREVLSVGPTYFIMKFIESVLDILMMYGAFATARGLAIARVFLHFLLFGSTSGFVTYLYVKVLEERSKSNSDSFYLRIYALVLGVYAAVKICFSLILRIPAFRNLTNKCDQWSLIQFFKWMRQERYYVGRGLYERTSDYCRYVLFWLMIFGCKFTFAYFLQIKPLVKPTRIILDLTDLKYSWHDFVSKNNHNFLTIATLWAPVLAIYALDLQIFYTLLSAIVGGLIGARDRLGEIRSIEMVHKRFESFPEAFVRNLQPPMLNMLHSDAHNAQASTETNKIYAAKFSPFWNEIIKSLREEDYITNREMELLLIPSNTGNLNSVQWPLFLLSSKIFLAIDLAVECRGTQMELWDRILRDEYMCYAVVECYYNVEKILKSLLDNEGRLWVERLFRDVNESLLDNSVLVNFQINKLPLLLSRMTALTGLLVHEETPDLAKGAMKAMQDLYDVVTHDILSSNLRENYDTWNILIKARIEGRLFSQMEWPKDPEIKEQIKRLHLLLTIKDYSVNIPKNLEARRRLEFFTNSLFMKMAPAKPVREMMPFSVFTPYYSETVMYSMSELRKENEDGISVLFYLQKIFPDEWKNFLERIGRDETTLDSELQDNSSDLLELRLWASYRGQTLARTVRGMMYYRKALMLQSYVEKQVFGDIEDGISGVDLTNTHGYELSREVRAQADLKFTYVVTCQIYGQQKQKRAAEAADIALLMQRNEALRVAYIDVVESLKDGKKEFYSKLVKADAVGNDQEIYSIKLPGDPKLGEGKPENQNHAIVFTRGEAVQTIDMNQDNYFEEALKMRNLLEEFHGDHGLRPPTILGVREHVFTGSVSSLAWFMSNQETSFVTLGQRVLANPLKVRMHYGHPDVFDRIFHITRGGISKASRVINISEDIYAGFNSTLRQGNITHHEYIQVGKGRDVGLNQIALFEGKVAGGNGEQVLSRDVYRLGQLFDFFRMLSFYFTTVGFYVCTMLTVLTVYVFLYGKAYLALSGLDVAITKKARSLDSTALEAALNTQFLFQIGVFTAVPMIMGFILEQGLLEAVLNFVIMQLELCSVFFTFSLGTRTHYFGRTLLHGGAKYRATGRGFVVRHIKFAENYRLYSRSHFVKAFEVIVLLIVYVAYGYANGAVSYVLLTISSWFLSISWLFAPYIFNPSGFEWQKTVQDFDDWTTWLLYKGGVGVKAEESWETWWDEEQVHIRTLRGRIFETILSLRFFIFQYGIVYKLHATGKSTNLSVYGLSWLILVAIILIFKVFTFSKKISVNFQLMVRFIQGATFIAVVTGLVVTVAISSLTVTDLFASILAFVPTGWAILCLAITWKSAVKRLGLWKSVSAIARLYDAGMGILLFFPIVVLSWFPFVSTFQTRLLFNQAFSRGLEISLILAGNKPNAQL